MLDKLDLWLSIIDIIICVIDIVLMGYLFFYRLPQEQKKPKFRSKIHRKTNRVWTRGPKLWVRF